MYNNLKTSHFEVSLPVSMRWWNILLCLLHPFQILYFDTPLLIHESKTHHQKHEP
ncbi:hypothetical protein BDV29DRAFT_186026, partial [Aspergillus leporis]